MSEKIKEVQERLKELGYFASEDLAKIVLLFEASGKKGRKSIPTLLLEGQSGAGKTFLAETFSKMIDADEKFVQCFPRMGAENFQYDVNIEGFMKQDPERTLKEGILLQTLQQSKKGPVVLVIDELDKARPEVDSFLLDFLENGRLTTGTDTYERGEFPIYVFITSNNKRMIDDALINRSKRVEILRPSKDLFLEILGLPKNHYLGFIYEKCPDFSLRQARQYLDDLEVLGVEFDEQALSQYINLDQLDVVSLADLKRISNMEEYGEKYKTPNLERCSIEVNMSYQQKLMEILKDGNKYGFEFYIHDDKPEELYMYIDTLEQLQKVAEHVDFDYYRDTYRGWFIIDLSEEEMNSDDIIWASNMNKKNGVRFGIKMIGDTMYRIAMTNGKTYVYLSSSSPEQLKKLTKQKEEKENENGTEFETDSEYDDDERDNEEEY